MVVARGEENKFQELAKKVFSAKRSHKNFAVVVHVLKTTRQTLVISRCCFTEKGQEMYNDLKRFCSAHETFGPVTFSFALSSGFA